MFSGFTLQFPIADIQHWAARYPCDDDVSVFDAGKQIRSGNCSRKNLEIIVDWKSNRRVDLIKKNSDEEIAEALHFAVKAKEPRTAVAVLMGLSGVGLPMSSAILMSIHQDRYTVIDWRALEALGVHDWYSDPNFYLTQYLPECRRIADISGVNLRTVDRALWVWSREKEKS